jgi:hypothetical protein
MDYHTGTDHVEIDINKAADQVLVSLNSSVMITVFPERSFSYFALIEFLSGSPGNQLKTFGDYIRPAIEDQQMDMIRGDRVVKYSQAIAFLGFKEPGKLNFFMSHFWGRLRYQEHMLS